MEQPTFITDDGDLRTYRTEIPNMVFESGLDPFSGWLYSHLKRIAGDSGVCWRGTRALAEITKMSVGAVSGAKADLKDRGLITIKEGDRKKGEADEIRVTNIWRRNFRHFDRDKSGAEIVVETPVHVVNTAQIACSCGEHPCSCHEHPCSSGEHKKEPLEEVTKEKSANALSKKPVVSSSTAIKGMPDEEALQRFDQLCEEDEQGRLLRDLAELLAEENKTGQTKPTRVWRELGRRYIETRQRHDLPEDAWRYGFEQAVARGAPNIGYVLKAAKGYRPEADRPGGRKNSIAVVGAREEDYDLEGYRFHE